MIKPIKIKNIQLNSNIILAPMAGVTDMGFRSICKSFGAALTVTEMVSAKALVYENKKTTNLLRVSSNESPKMVQIFGSDEDIMARAVKLKCLNKFDIYDINMGCPAAKITGNGEGSALMLDINKAEKIIRAVVAATSKPVTVKFRKGYDEQHVNAVDFAKMCERAGASAITVHGRTRSQFYMGESDRNIIKECVKAVKIPVFASGDVFSAQDAREILCYTGAAGIMIARGALGNPEIFAELTGSHFKLSKFNIIKRHGGILIKNFGEKFAVLNMRKHLAYYLKGFSGAAKIKNEIMKMERWSEVLNLLQEFFKNTSKNGAKTDVFNG